MRLEHLIAETVVEELAEIKRRYTHRPNINLMDNLSESCDHQQVRKPLLKEGCSFIEPMAGQGYNDQFPWR